MYLVGIDIAKYNHQCFIATKHGEVISEFSFDNNLVGFKQLQNKLAVLDHSLEIKIGLEATGHYGNNLKQFISANGYTFVEFNPFLAKQFFRSTTIRKTKTDKVDARLISKMLMSIDYETLHVKYYHINELKSLTRTRNTLIRNRSKYLVQVTNSLDIKFPEFKPFFNNRLGKTALYMLKHYKTKLKISRITKVGYEKLYNLSRGSFSYPKFLKLRNLANNSVGIDSDSHSMIISNYISLIESTNEALKQIEEEITALMNLTNTKLTSIPGVSILSAATILAEIGDIKNFSNPAKLIAFAGFDVAIYQSGEKECYGRLVKRGSKVLRTTVWNLVMGSIRLIPTITDYYHKKRAEGKHHRVIQASISRKLIRIIYHLETNKINFDHLKLR